jgi:large subunit ribosomal protein L15
MAEELNLSNLKPAQARKNRKRVGRGLGSGKGRYSGRGIKGQKSRSGSNKMRPGFEGGQNPIYMRLAKQRGGSKDAMPVGPHRTSTVPLNVAALEERFDAGAEVTLEALVEKGLIRNTRTDVKLLGQGDLSKKLSITVHAASATAREKVEAAGGSLTLLREPKARRPKRRPESSRPAQAEEVEPEAEETEETDEPQAEAVEAGPEAEAEAEADEGEES